MFNQCDAQPTINQPFEKITLRTYGNAHDIEVVLCTVAGEGHHIRHDLRDKADRIALDFLMNHRRNANHKQDKYNPNE